MPSIYSSTYLLVTGIYRTCLFIYVTHAHYLFLASVLVVVVVVFKTFMVVMSVNGDTFCNLLTCSLNATTSTFIQFNWLICLADWLFVLVICLTTKLPYLLNAEIYCSYL